MTDLQLIFAFVIGVLATARVTRLFVDDDFPPVVALRDAYLRFLAKKFDAVESEDGARKADSWYGLVQCPWCFGFWASLLATGYAWLSFNGDGKLDWWWWVPNLPWAVSWLVGFMSVRDIPEDQRAQPE